MCMRWVHYVIDRLGCTFRQLCGHFGYQLDLICGKLTIILSCWPYKSSDGPDPAPGPHVWYACGPSHCTTGTATNLYCKTRLFTLPTGTYEFIHLVLSNCMAKLQRRAIKRNLYIDVQRNRILNWIIFTIHCFGPIWKSTWFNSVHTNYFVKSFSFKLQEFL